MRDTPNTIDNARNQKVPEVLRDSGNQRGHAPGNNVKNERGEAAAHFICDHTAKRGEKDLKSPTDADDQANLFIRKSQRHHED